MSQTGISKSSVDLLSTPIILKDTEFTLIETFEILISD